MSSNQQSEKHENLGSRWWFWWWNTMEARREWEAEEDGDGLGYAERGEENWRKWRKILES